MSRKSVDPALFRILDALRTTDLNAGDAAWLFDHLLAVALESEAREGHPADNQHAVWVAIDVALHPQCARKIIARDWGATVRQIEYWQKLGREQQHASAMLCALRPEFLAPQLARQRELYKSKVNLPR